MAELLVQFYKNPDLPHWRFLGVRLGEDEHGLWVGLPRGSLRWKADVEWSPSDVTAVLCFPHRGWWALHYTGAATRFSHFVDITTPPRWDGEKVEMIDLDLDVTRGHDGVVAVEDEDEFAVHQVRYRYTVEMIKRAVAETALVRGWLEAGAEPFFTVAAEWLGHVEPP